MLQMENEKEREREVSFGFVLQRAGGGQVAAGIRSPWKLTFGCVQTIYPE